MRDLTREEAEALVQFGPFPNGRVGVLIVGIFSTIAAILALVWTTETPALLSLAGPLVLAEVALFFWPIVLRMRRARFVIRNGSRVRGRVLRYERVGWVGAYPASPLLDLTVELTTPEGVVAQAETRDDVSGRDPRLLESLVGREAWVYWHPRFPRLAVPERPGSLTGPLAFP